MPQQMTHRPIELLEVEEKELALVQTERIELVLFEVSAVLRRALTILATQVAASDQDHGGEQIDQELGQHFR